MKFTKLIIGVTSSICTFSMLAVAPTSSFAQEKEEALLRPELFCYPAIQCAPQGTSFERVIPDMTNVYIQNGVLIGLSEFLGGTKIAIGSFLYSTYYSIAAAYWKPMSMKITYTSGTSGGISKVVYYSQKNFKGKSQTRYR